MRGIGVARAKPLRHQREPHDDVASHDDSNVALGKCALDAGRQHERAGHLDEHRYPIERIVVVIGRGKPGEIDPCPGDGKDHHGIAGQAVADVVFHQIVMEGSRGEIDGDDEDEIEEELERRRGAMDLMGIARRPFS